MEKVEEINRLKRKRIKVLKEKGIKKIKGK